MPLLIYAANEWYGPGCGAAVVAASGGLTADAKGTARTTATMTGSGAITGAHVTGLKNSPCTMQGSGSIVSADVRGDGRMALTISIGSRPTAEDIAEAIWNRLPNAMAAQSIGDTLALAAKLLRNKTVTDPSAGTMTVYDDDDETPLASADIFEDAAGTTPYSGLGVNRRERLE